MHDTRFITFAAGWSLPRLVQYAMAGFLCLSATVVNGQSLQIRYGTPVPIEVKTTYEDGLRYLVDAQRPNGTWQGASYGTGPGVDGLCLLAMLASGEDPNFGKYADEIRRTIRSLVRAQDANSGLIAMSRGSHGNMYHHGFATLAMAEAYGAVDEQLLWNQAEAPRALGAALELAVRCIIESQNQNPYGGWRYTPNAKDADVSVSGANIVALLAARNAGIAVPDENIEKCNKLLEQSTDASGAVAYQVGSSGFAFGDSQARSSIACLCLAIAKHKDSDAFKATLRYLQDHVDQPPSSSWPYYSRYYMAQAMFQGDFDSWEKWNQLNTEIIMQEQREDGCIGRGPYTTAMSLLSMALNFRFLPIYER